MRIYLPFASREELRLEQESGELLVGVRNESRRFPIPPEFARMEVAGRNSRGISEHQFSMICNLIFTIS